MQLPPRRRRCVTAKATVKAAAAASAETKTKREPNHFLKAILPSPIHAHQLRIPDEFIARFGNELTDVAKISVPDGCIWELGVKKCGEEEDVFFCKNWPRFAKYYSIGYGSYLVFKYQGNSKFSVVIFDPTSAEIHYPTVRKIGDDDDDEFNGKLAHDTTTASAISASQRAKVAAKEFKPKNPSFISTIRSKRVYVSADFASKYLSPNVSVKLQNSNGEQQWNGICRTIRVRSVPLQLVGGFSIFARDNGVSDGDTCVFELIKRRRPVVLKVTAFRAVDFMAINNCDD